MDFVQVLLIIGAVAGGGLVAVSFIGPKTEDIPLPPPPQEMFLDKRLEDMGSTISEADNIITELGGMSRDVMKEMDQKYNELLFLYNLIDEKKEEISTRPKAAAPAASMPSMTPMTPASPMSPTSPMAPLPPALAPMAPAATRPATQAASMMATQSAAKAPPMPAMSAPPLNPRFSRIMELKQMGLSIEQIAKEMNIGQGEVSLVMSLTGNL